MLGNINGRGMWPSPFARNLLLKEQLFSFLFSLSMAKTTILSKGSASETTVKRRKVAGDRRHDQPLLPGLPDHLAQLCLSHLKPYVLFSVSLSWRRLLYSPFFPPFLSLYALVSSQSDSDCCFSVNNFDSAQFFTFDPISSNWVSLPPRPADPPVCLLLRHPSFLSRNLPVQSISVNGQLVLLAATTHNFCPALTRPIIFDPIGQTWELGPPLSTPRRWCAAGSLGTSVYVASGIGSHFSSEVARSFEKWDLHRGKLILIHDRKEKQDWGWEKVCALKDGNFSRDAIDAVGWRGKLCMVNVKGDAPKEGAVYDVKNDVWEEMPDGMLAGWRGPAAAMNEEEMYVVDEKRGTLKKYDPIMDGWEEIMESERFRGAVQIAAGGGRVCVVSKGGRGLMVVDVGVAPPKVWKLDSPLGLEVMALHILPRMSHPNL